jgi:hypothetical protein
MCFGSAWRVILLAEMGEPLTKDDLKTFTQFTGRKTAPSNRMTSFGAA